MRRTLFVFVLFFSLITFGQNSDPSLQETQKKSPDTFELKEPIPGDTNDRSIEARDNNMESILALTKEMDRRRERDKRNAIIKIGIGVLLLGVLVVGLTRKRKK
jgi:hypothetical protein